MQFYTWQNCKTLVLHYYACKNTIRSSVKLHRSTVYKNTPPKKAAGAGKNFTLFFCVILHFNFKCVLLYKAAILPHLTYCRLLGITAGQATNENLNVFNREGSGWFTRKNILAIIMYWQRQACRLHTIGDYQVTSSVL